MSNIIVAADQAVMQAELTTPSWEQVKEEWDKAGQMSWQAVQQAAKVGAMLLEMRDGLSQSEFVQRAGQEAGISKSQAFNLMSLARNLPLLEQHQPNSQREALALIKAQQPVPLPASRPAPMPPAEQTYPDPPPSAALNQWQQDTLKHMRAEFDRQLAEERARLKEADAEAAESYKTYVELSRNVTPLLTASDFRLIQNCLHPDRAPAERRDRFNDAFLAINKLAPYFEKLRMMEKRREQQSERSKAMWANRKAAEASSEAVA